MIQGARLTKYIQYINYEFLGYFIHNNRGKMCTSLTQVYF